MRKILLTCFIVLASAFQILAQCLMHPVLLSQRVPQSSLIVEGKVINQQCFWNSNHDKIYTSNLVEVYKTFKNASPAYIEIITEGGIVGNDKHVFEPTLELEVGDVGVFTLNQNSQLSQFGKQTYDAYASAQGFIKYDVASNIASEPFNTYQNASSTLYNTIAQYTGANYVQVKPINPFQIAAQNTSAVQNVAAITSFTPTTITAGTFSVLTINGSGFGATSTPSLITFKNADDGGATTISPIANQIVSWTNTQIQVMVPSKAGTGVIGVNGANSSTALTIPYSHINVTYTNNIVYNTKHINQSGGGYTWTYNTNFNTNTPAKAAFQRSLQSWRCATYINWPTASTTSTITASANDGTNIVTFNSGLAAGILGQCGSYFSGCSVSGVFQWYVSEMDIQFANTPGGLTWQYGTAAPSASQYDFESVTVHELGHGHQLGHVIKTTDLMHYALSNGQSKRTLNIDDLNGGLTVMTRNAQTGGTCNLPLMVPLTAGNCALGAPSASFSANRTTVCPGQTVVFTDLSTGTPTALAWTFAGGTPSTSSVSSPTITYNTPGTYSVQLVATNVNGTSTYSVAAYINVVSPASLPLVQDFQSATYPPTNWYLTDAGADNIKWQLSTSAGYNSTQSTVFNNWTDSVTPNRDELKTYVNLSGYSTAKMTFYRSYSQTFTTPYIDTLQIGISTNCGTSTTYPYLKGGSQLATATTATSSAVFTPTAASQWVKDSVDLTPYVGQANVMIAFINRGHYGDAIYLDNINITGVGATSPTAAITSASIGCTGTPITLTDASTGGPTSWTWTMAGGTPSVATTQNTSVTYSTAGVKTITLTVANGTGTTTATKTITITATPTVAVSVTNTTICSGGSVVETLTGATTYTWLPSGSGTTSTLTPTSTTVYTITGSTGGCVSAVRNVTVTVTPNPTVNIVASSSTICAGQTATLTASGATAYAWLPGAQTATVITVTPTITSTYTVNGSVGTCYGTKTISINVTSTPTVAASITNTTICSSTSVNVSVTGATTYTWLPSGSGNASTLTPSSTTVYTVTGSNGSCVSAPKNFTINVITTPTININASSSTVCAGQTVTLTASGATAYSWLPGAQTTTVITVNPTSTTSYTVNGANGTCYGTKTISINVTSPPTITTSITNTTICSGSSINVSVTGASTYTWLPSGSGNTSTLTPSSTTVYTVTGSNGSCISNPNTFTVIVSPNPTVVATSTNPTCPGSCNGIINASASGGTVPYVYSVIGGSTTCPSIPCYSVCGSPSAYVVIVTDVNGCMGSTNVNVIDPPPINASVTHTNASCSSCTDGIANVNVTFPGGVAPYSYTWTPGGQNTPLVSGLSVGCYTVQITDAVGCSNSFSTCISFATGITPLQNITSNLSVYPNPSNGLFTISNAITTEKLDVLVTNAIGQTVLSETAKNTIQIQIDLSKMSKGIYYLKASTSEGTKLFKLILE